MRSYRPLIALGIFLSCTPAIAAPTTINGVTYNPSKAPTGQAPSTSIDASLKLKKVFLFPSLDDMSGVLAPKLDEKLVQLLTRNSRFDLVRDPQVLKALSPDDAAYGKAAQSPQVHREAARVTGSDTTVILRTRNVGNETEMTLEFRDADGGILFSESGSIPGFSPMDARWGLVDKLFQMVLSKIPFDGTVTGRSANTLTLDLGSSAIKRGEELDLARVVSVQRHPLLKTIVGTDYVRVGRAKVTSVDRTLSFADIIEEFPGELISSGVKVLRTKTNHMRRPEPQEEYSTRDPRGRSVENEGPDHFEERLSGDFDQKKARYGQVGLNLQYGSLTHTQSVSGTASEYSGSGIGGGIEGELWVTKNWIVNLNYSFQSAQMAGSGVSVGDASWRRVDAFAGYRIFPDDILDGAQATGSLGYQIQDFTIPTPAGVALSGKRYSGLAVRLDGELMIYTNHKLSVGFGFQPFSSLLDAGAAPGSPDGATVIGFHLGWNYRFANSFWGRLGMQYDTASGNYTNNSTVTDKRFAIGPGVFYSF